MAARSFAFTTGGRTRGDGDPADASGALPAAATASGAPPAADDEPDTTAQVPGAATADVSGNPLATPASGEGQSGRPPLSQFSSGGNEASRAALASIDQLLLVAQAAAEEGLAAATRVASAPPNTRPGGRMLKRPASRSAPIPPPWRQAVSAGDPGRPAPSPRVPFPRPKRVYGSAGGRLSPPEGCRRAWATTAGSWFRR